ncbi:MAG: ATP-binding protein [Verrucomicrobiae bacterium]|nr:ATP-binding protein [Verrucomicrobiae bacterium]
MIPRNARLILEEMARTFPVVAVTGPRQSGKTTLCRKAFDHLPYASLEDPDVLEHAMFDPRGFLERNADGVVLDEVQRCPELFSYLQGFVDQDPRPGRFILTGSQQFGLMASITQSLAGRVALLSLLPFSVGELRGASLLPSSLDELIVKGSYPPIYDRGPIPSIWYASYVQTYVERDVRQLINVRDLIQFQRFLRLCAGRTGQLLNFSALGDEAGVSHNTAREWISVLEASYVVHRLPPHFRNFNKRLVKTPKLYFYDCGLAAWLLGIESPDHLETHPLRGALFETWVVSEFLKRRFNQGQPSNLSFWRNQSGLEVDIVEDQAGVLFPIEVKSGATVTRDSLKGLLTWTAMAATEAGQARLVSGSKSGGMKHGIEIIPWHELFG